MRGNKDIEEANKRNSLSKCKEIHTDANCMGKVLYNDGD